MWGGAMPCRKIASLRLASPECGDAQPGGDPSPSPVRPIRHLRLPPRANLPHRVNPPTLALEISSRQYLAQQPRAKQNHARHQQQRREHHQWTMLRNQIATRPNLLDRQPEQSASAQPRADQSPLPEKMHRPRKIFQQKPNGENVEHYPKRPAKPIMRSPRRTRQIANRHLRPPSSVKRRQRRNEPMQLAIQVDVLQNLRAISLESRAEVPQLNARNLRHHPIRNPGRNLPRHGIIQPVLPPPASDVVPFFDFFKQRRNILGSMLQIAIERNDNAPLSLLESRRQRRRLPEIPPQPDDLQPMIGLHQIRQQIKTLVRRSIVRKNNLVRLSQLLQHRRQPVIKRKNRRFLIVNRNNNRQHRHLL